MPGTTAAVSRTLPMGVLQRYRLLYLPAHPVPLPPLLLSAVSTFPSTAATAHRYGHVRT
jgi:hypothetical protein